MPDENNNVIEIQMRTPEDMLEDVANLRETVANKEDDLATLKAYLESTMAYQSFAQAQEELKEVKKQLQLAEESARIRLQIHVDDTGENKGFGWKTRNVDKPKYSPEQALAWASRQPLESDLISLNIKTFEKTAKQTRGTNLENSTDQFVDWETVTQILLTKELNPDVDAND